MELRWSFRSFFKILLATKAYGAHLYPVKSRSGSPAIRAEIQDFRLGIVIDPLRKFDLHAQAGV
jgi:hypothetical protein